MEMLEAMFLEGLYAPLESNTVNLPEDSSSPPPPPVQSHSNNSMYMYKCTHFFTRLLLIDGTCTCISTPAADNGLCIGQDKPQEFPDGHSLPASSSTTVKPQCTITKVAQQKTKRRGICK